MNIGELMNSVLIKFGEGSHEWHMLRVMYIGERSGNGKYTREDIEKYCKKVLDKNYRR